MINYKAMIANRANQIKEEKKNPFDKPFGKWTREDFEEALRIQQKKDKEEGRHPPTVA